MGFSAKLSSLLGLAVGRCRMRAWWAAGRATPWVGLSPQAVMGLLGYGLPASWVVRATASAWAAHVVPRLGCSGRWANLRTAGPLVSKAGAKLVSGINL